MTTITIALSFLLLYFIAKLTLAHIRRPKLPSPDQGPLWRRLFTDPSPTQKIEWALTIPNDGLISFRGALNKEKIIVCSTAGAKVFAETMPDTLVHEPGTIKIIEELLGNGLVSAWGDEHKKQRKQLLPVFKIQTIRGLYPTFWKKTQELLSVLDSETKDSDAYDITNIIHRATLDIIGLAGFGMDFNCLSRPGSQLWTEYATAFSPSPEAAWAWILHRAFPSLHSLLGWLLKFNEASKRALGMMRRRIERVIEDKRDKPDKNDNDDLISILLRQSLITDPSKLLDQSLTILGAGHDTISSNLSLIMYHLAKYPHTQAKLREEIRSVLPITDKELGLNPADDSPSSETLEKLESAPYIQALVNETLRLYPIIPWTARMTTAPTQICNQIIPAGVSVFLMRGAMHRNPDLWSHNPSVFYPERWIESPNGGTKWHQSYTFTRDVADSIPGAKERLAFMGFGAGPRNCIGERFARSEIAILLAGLLGRYEFEFVGVGEQGKEGELKLEMGIVLRILGGLWVRVKKLET